MSKEKERIEITRKILHNAVIMNMSNDLILKISEKLDDNIVDYYRKEMCQGDRDAVTPNEVEVSRSNDK